MLTASFEATLRRSSRIMRSFSCLATPKTASDLSTIKLSVFGFYVFFGKRQNLHNWIHHYADWMFVLNYYHDICVFVFASVHTEAFAEIDDGNDFASEVGYSSNVDWSVRNWALRLQSFLLHGLGWRWRRIRRCPARRLASAFLLELSLLEYLWLIACTHLGEHAYDLGLISCLWKTRNY